jgi:hypothetical protein
MKVLATMVLGFALSGCLSIRNATISSFQVSRGATVSAEASALGYVNLTSPNPTELEKAAIEQLRQKGATKNVTSRLEVRDWLVLQVYTLKATAER